MPETGHFGSTKPFRKPPAYRGQRNFPGQPALAVRLPAPSPRRSFCHQDRAGGGKSSRCPRIRHNAEATVSVQPVLEIEDLSTHIKLTRSVVQAVGILRIRCHIGAFTRVISMTRHKERTMRILAVEAIVAVGTSGPAAGRGSAHAFG